MLIVQRNLQDTSVMWVTVPAFTVKEGDIIEVVYFGMKRMARATGVFPSPYVSWSKEHGTILLSTLYIEFEGDN